MSANIAQLFHIEIKKQKKDGRNFKDNGRISKDCGRNFSGDAGIFLYNKKSSNSIEYEDLRFLN